MSEPWKDWIPGALNDSQLGQLISTGSIENAAGCKTDYSSFDLTLDDEGYEMLQGSVKPQGMGYEHFLKAKTAYARPLKFEGDGTLLLNPKKTYVFKLKERLSRALSGSSIHGQATAKSSVGRVDVLARLIVDGMHQYEGFDTSVWNGGSGNMFLEVTSMTFKVRVKVGTSLSQLRLFQGKPEFSEMSGPDLYGAVLLSGGQAPPDGCLRVDVNPIQVTGKPVAAFRAKTENQSPVNLWVDKDEHGEPINRPNPTTYWDFDESENGRFRVRQPNFYILRSKERMMLDRGVCVYCRAIDETIGEMRIHYAGFVHPYFGYTPESGQKQGTPLIFEVRGHDVNVLLSDNEPLARLQFYRMSQDCPANPDVKKLSPYNDQTLRLSQFFEDFPEN